MTRLTNNLRDKIVANAMAKTPLAAEKATLQQDKYTLAEAFRIASLGGPEEAARLQRVNAKLEKEIAAIPDALRNTFMPMRHDYEMERMNLGGLRVSLLYAAGTADRRICPTGAVFEGDHPLVLQFHELTNREAAIEKRSSDLRIQVNAVLDSCTTVKKLLDVWPEAKELLPTYVEEARPQLPAVQTAELNALIGLPTPE